MGLLAFAAGSAAPPRSYRNDFENCEIGKVPADLLVLDGTFAVRAVDGNRCLELAGDPIGSFGVLFGPDGLSAMEVKARIWAAAQGRRFPEFGIGADDVGGYKVLLAPGRGVLELRKGDRTVSACPCQWSSGAWTCFRLRVAPDAKGVWLIQCKAWPRGSPEPAQWMIVHQDPAAPSPGRASAWGSDFSEQPIRFDDLSVIQVARAASP